MSSETLLGEGRSLARIHNSDPDGAVVSQFVRSAEDSRAPYGRLHLHAVCPDCRLDSCEIYFSFIESVFILPSYYIFTAFILHQTGEMRKERTCFQQSQ